MTLILHKQMNIIFTIFLLTFVMQAQSHQFSKKLSAKSLGLKKEELTHLHFYFHDIMSSSQPTGVRVAQAATTNTSKTRFGVMAIVDDPLTTGPELTSKIVGRMQGITASADLNISGFLMVFNYIFTEGKYNGSSLSILGRFQGNLVVREMPIVGGTGLFRFARGYALVKTQFFNASNGDGTYEFNAYVFHY